MKNKNWLIYIVVGIILIAIISAIIIIIRNGLNDTTESLSKKIEDELEYLDKTTITMINQLNNLKTEDEIQIIRTSVGNNTGNTTNSSGQESSSESGGKDEKSSSSSESESSSGSSDEQPKEIEKYYMENDTILLRDANMIDWNNLEAQAENLYNSWTTITLDLNTMNVSSDDILAYNTNLDNLMLSIKEQNKVNSAICLANLYSLVPKYMKETLDDEKKLKIENVKSNVVSAYSLVETERWDDILKLLGNAEKELTTFINSANNLSYTKQSKINKAYVLLKELIKSSNEKNKDLFYFKYINLIQELEFEI